MYNRILNKIKDIYHYIYDNECNSDIEIYIYFSIKSIIEIGNPKRIYLYYIQLPNGKLWNNLIDNIYFNKIELILNKFKLVNKKNIIYEILNKYGGVYIDKYSILINSINNLINYDYKKSSNDEIINLNYDNSYEKINDYIFKEINDYTFGDYFHIIKNYYILNIENNKNNLININLNDIMNKITIYNLLIRYILTYKNINNEKIYKNLLENNYLKLKLINNIDKIYWINLEKSIYRNSKMIQLLSNFEIKNIRINAIDGDIINDIDKKYFICEEENNYPKYSNKEYAVLLSHLIAIETYITSENNIYNVAMICEDDLSIDFISYWKEDLKTIIENAPQNWEIIMLGYFSINLNRKNIYEKWNNEWSAISYLINYNIINKINNLKKDNKWICNKNSLMVSDNYIFSNFNTYVYKYPYFTFPDNNNSTLHEDHINYHRIYKISNYITLENKYDFYIDIIK